MSENRTILFGAAAAAVAVGAYLVIGRRSDGDTGTQPGDEDFDGSAYDAQDSDRFIRDRGAAVSSTQFDKDGKVLSSIGSENYRPGNTVSGNLPALFGAKSYRNSICTLSSEITYSTVGDAQGRVYGPSRRASRSSRNGWEWNRATWQTGDLGSWLTNGVPIVAKSWSCGSSERAGTNNVNCRSRRRSSQDGGGLGLYPMDFSLHTRWKNQGELGVPLIEYSGDSGEGLAGQIKYPGLSAYGRFSVGKSGYLGRDGRLWIKTTDSMNFKHISDEDPDVEYFIAAVGEQGGVTARRKSNGRSVSRRDFRIRWKGLSNAECRQFLRAQALEKVDPWSIPGSPWEALDQMKAGTWNIGGGQYNLDFRPARRLNERFRQLIRTNPVLLTEVRSGDIVMPNFVSFRNDGLVGDWNWPVISYGLVNPYAGKPSEPNSLPVDFGAPVALNYFADMPYVQQKFSGDS